MATKAKAKPKGGAGTGVKPGEITEYPPLHWLGLGSRMTPRALLHPVYGAAATFAAGQLADAADWSAWAVAPGSLAALAGAGAALSAGPHTCGPVKTFMAAIGAAAGAYLTSVAATSPYSTASLVTGAVAAAGAFLAYPRVREAQAAFELAWYTDRLPTDRMAATAGADLAPVTVPGQRDADAARWEATFAAAGLKGLTFLRRDGHYAGFSVTMMLPTNGSVEFRACEQATTRIEMSLYPDRGGLPEGSVSVERGRGVDGRVMARLVVFHFNLRDVLAETIVMPGDHEPLSINSAFPVGKFIDGETIYLKLREIAALIVGVRGRGKSNFLNVLVYQISRCVDAVLWIVDLKGGRFVKPWLQPWLSGARRPDGRKVRRPPIDWVATTRVEAHRMFVALQAVISFRANSGYGGEKLEPAAPVKGDPTRMPAIIAIVDEWAALAGSHSSPKTRRAGDGPTSNDFANWALSVAQLGRSECVDELLATQRSTVSMTGSGTLKSQLELRVGLGVTNKADATSVFDNDPEAARLLVKLQDQRTRGAMLLRDGNDGRTMLGKAYRIATKAAEVAALGGRNLLDEAAHLHGDIRPDLDELSARAADEALRAMDLDYWAYPPEEYGGYDDRWAESRARHLYHAGLAPAWDDSMEPDEAGDEPDEVPAPRPGGGRTAVLDRPAAARHTRPAAASLPQTGGVDPYAGLDRELLAHAAELVISTRLGSHAMLSRKLRVSLDQAKAYMAALEALGVVGPRLPERTRDVLVPTGHLARAVSAIHAGEAVPGAVRPADVAAIEAGLAGVPDADEVDPALADAPGGRPDGLGAFVRIVRDAGPRGCGTAHVKRELRRLGLLTDSNENQVYRWREAALTRGLVEQPGGQGSNYYHPDHRGAVG